MHLTWAVYNAMYQSMTSNKMQAIYVESATGADNGKFLEPMSISMCLAELCIHT
jgi:hypothetical protein